MIEGTYQSTSVAHFQITCRPHGRHSGVDREYGVLFRYSPINFVDKFRVERLARFCGLRVLSERVFRVLILFKTSAQMLVGFFAVQKRRSDLRVVFASPTSPNSSLHRLLRWSARTSI